MSCIGNGKLVRVVLEDHRMAQLDLDCADDWGDIRITPKYNDEFGKTPVKIELGNDEDGWYKIVGVYEQIDKEGNCEDFIDEKFDTYIECKLDDLIEWCLIREIAYCEGMTIAEHKKLMEEYGFFDFGNIEGTWDSIIGWKYDYKIDDPKLEETAIAIQNGIMDFIKDINENPEKYFEEPKFSKVIEIPTNDEIKDAIKLILPDDWDECESLTDEQRELIKKIQTWSES